MLIWGDNNSVLTESIIARCFRGSCETRDESPQILSPVIFQEPNVNCKSALYVTAIKDKDVDSAAHLNVWWKLFLQLCCHAVCLSLHLSHHVLVTCTSFWCFDAGRRNQSPVKLCKGESIKYPGKFTSISKYNDLELRRFILLEIFIQLQVYTNGLYTPTAHRVINAVSLCLSFMSVPLTPLWSQSHSLSQALSIRNTKRSSMASIFWGRCSIILSSRMPYFATL